ncbi:MAG: PEP-CTERM sorting domain-containing protein [Myxococcota bacterium]
MRRGSGRPRAFRLVPALAALLIAAPFTARAATVIDQQNLVGGAGIGPTRTQSYQQGLTAGGSGLLAQVDLNILYLACCAQPAGFGATNTFLLDVYGTPPWNGQPYNATTPLASIPVTVTQTGWLSIDVSSAGLVLSPGQQFALGLRSDVYWDLGIDSSGPYNPYGGGSLYGNGGLIQGNNQGVGAWDLVFKTYLSTPVPEPGTALLVGLGLAALGATRRRDAR